jgi:hypothetical protein
MYSARCQVDAMAALLLLSAECLGKRRRIATSAQRQVVQAAKSLAMSTAIETITL